MAGLAFVLQFGTTIALGYSIDIVWRHFYKYIKSYWPILTCQLAPDASKLTTETSAMVKARQSPLAKIIGHAKNDWYIQPCTH